MSYIVLQRPVLHNSVRERPDERLTQCSTGMSPLLFPPTVITVKYVHNNAHMSGTQLLNTVSV